MVRLMGSCGGGTTFQRWVGRVLVVSVAVGVTVAGAGTARAAVRWHVMPSPHVRAGSLNDVSCVSSSWCIAVGDRLVERWNGVRWSVLHPPRIGREVLLSVSCTSRQACMAVGYGRGQVVAERLNGRRWSVAALPAGGDFFPDSVSCASSSSCMAVPGPSPGNETLYGWRWNGRNWRLTTPFLPGSEYSFVSCAAASFCEGVATTPSNALETTVAAGGWDGMSWAAQSTPSFLSSAALAQFAGVACTSKTFCIAVGDFAPPTGFTDMFMLRLTGNRWIRQKIGQPRIPGDFLDALSCVSRTSCTALGGQSTGDSTSTAFAMGWNGRSWSKEKTPNPPNANDDDYLSGISCTSRTVCTAVGETNLGNRPLIERSSEQTRHKHVPTLTG